MLTRFLRGIPSVSQSSSATTSLSRPFSSPITHTHTHINLSIMSSGHQHKRRYEGGHDSSKRGRWEGGGGGRGRGSDRGGWRGGGGGGNRDGGRDRGRGGGGRGGRGGRGGGRGGNACFKCGGSGHMARDCTGEARPQQGGRGCFKCGSTEHLARECTTPTKTSLTQEEIQFLRDNSTLDLDIDIHLYRGEHIQPLKEDDVGITSYINQENKGFQAILKHRSTDFIVNEISPTGEVYRLTDLSIPIEPHLELAHRTDQSGTEKLATLFGEPHVMDAFDRWYEQQSNLLDEQQAQKKRVAKIFKNSNEAQQQGFVFESILTKEQRTTFHAIIRTSYPELVSDTVDIAAWEVMKKKLADDAEKREKEEKNDDMTDTTATTDTTTTATETSTSTSTSASTSTTDSTTSTTTTPSDSTTSTSTSTEPTPGPTRTAPSTTKDSDKYVRVFFSARVKTEQRQTQWPKSRPDYLHFLLFKENTSTMDALGMITRQCHLGSTPINKLFQFAGNKDKRAITTQAITAYRVPAEALRKGIHTRSGYSLQVGNFSYVSQPLRLGALKGNRFTIVMRSISTSENEVSTALETLSKTGFINYFGMQRFGTGVIPTHHVGKALLKREWGKAIALLLMPRALERPDIAAARQYFYDTRDGRGAAQKMPNVMSVEQQLLRHLGNSPNDFLGAIASIPRGTRLIYVHAWQSWIWNQMCSERINISATDVLVGDVVLQSTISTSTSTSTTSSTSSSTSSSSSSSSTSTSTDTKSDDIDLPLDENDEFATDMLGQAHIITQDDIDNKRYTIQDVVLPLPGYAVVFPTNVMGEKYRELLASEGVTTEQLRNLKSDSGIGRDFSLVGNYRKILAMPGDFEWSLVRYADDRSPLALTDLARLNGAYGIESDPEAPHLAARLEFSLPSSAYATMLIREVTRQSTTPEYQKELSAKHTQQQQKQSEEMTYQGKIDPEERAEAEEEINSSAVDDGGDNAMQTEANIIEPGSTEPSSTSS